MVPSAASAASSETSVGLVHRHHQNSEEEEDDTPPLALRILDNRRRKKKIPTQPRSNELDCVRVLVMSVLWLGIISLFASLLWLPSIVEENHVKRNTLGTIPSTTAVNHSQVRWLYARTDMESNHSNKDVSRLSAAIATASSPLLDVVPSSTVGDSGLVDGYRSHAEMSARSTRFPTVDERVRVYMTNWYLPPCDAHGDAYVEYNYAKQDNGTEWLVFREARTAREKIRGKLRTFLVDDSTDFDLLRHMNVQNILDCQSNYCIDTAKYLFPAIARSSDRRRNTVVLYQFSDAEKTRAYIPAYGRPGPYPNIPHLKKFRFALSRAERDRVVNSGQGCSTSPRPVPMTIVQQQQLLEGAPKVIPTAQPVIFKLKMQRHYGYVKAIPAQDRLWSLKRDQAIFRGQFTGRFSAGMDKRLIEELAPVEQCQLLHRCRLVYSSAANRTADQTPLVDAKLALPVLDVRQNFPKTINGIDLYGERVSIEDMLAYKAIIMLEGNDVSSGLKWALYSNSVVMTQTPTKTSWAMEELLEPWVHYIPLADDLSDVEDMMRWVIDHDDEAQEIANRGRVWISDLVFHPDAETDEQHVFDEILRRYQAHFVRNATMQLPEAQ